MELSLHTALTALVQDWKENLSEEEAKMPLAVVAETLGRSQLQDMAPHLASESVAWSIMDYLAAKGHLESVVERISRYRTINDLLEETDLHELMEVYADAE